MKKLSLLVFMLVALVFVLPSQTNPPLKAQKDDWILAVLSSSDGKPIGTALRFVFPDGTIRMSTQGIQINVADATEDQIAGMLLQELLQKKFAAELNFSAVQVTIFPKGSNKVFITGLNIKKQGVYPYETGMTVMKAIENAGGIMTTPVIRVKFANGDPDKLLSWKKLQEQDFPLNPGDGVLVEFVF